MTTEEEKSDIFAVLPEPILGLILSKMLIKQAILCSFISKRWRCAFTHISQLNIDPSLVRGLVHPRHGMTMAMAEYTLCNFLQFHLSHLEVFHLNNNFHPSGLSRWRFTNEGVSKWVQFAASKNVDRLILCGNILVRATIPSTLFSCAHLTSLHISNYFLSDIPTHLPHRFNNLINCSLNSIESTDESLASFISHSPLLQNLAINSCVRLSNPVISAPNITHLDVNTDGGNYGMEVLTIECPKLITLKASMIRNLRVNGVCFHDLSYVVCELKMQRGSLIELRLEPFLDREPGPYIFSAERILDIVGTFKSLKKLSIAIREHRPARKNQEMAVPLFALFERLPNLELLHMGGILTSELARGRIPPCLNFPLGNLRKAQVVINNFDEKEISVLGCLLQSAPALEIMQIYLPVRYEDAQYIGFLEKMLYLRRASVQARICITYSP